MRMRSPVLLACSMLLVPALLAAQDRRQMQGERGGMMMPQQVPSVVLLEHRAQLQLTSEQVQKITALNEALAEKNKPHLEQIERARTEMRQGMNNQDRQRMRTQMERLRPHMEAVRQNNQATLGEVEKLLTDEQARSWAEIREQLMRQQRRRPPGR